ncbi:hypothetical protein FOM00_08450 [Pseudomonas sp. ST1]|nr:hypothetical protein CC202_00255 [Pseudomonas savastanoi]TSC37540.1 hypothetical protein FOM00_08450 [Pseudomonas sp. ST1]
MRIVPTLRVVMPFVTLCVTQFCDSVRFRVDSGHLFAPRRVTLTGQSNQTPRSCFRPDFVGFLRPDTNVALCVVSAIAVKKHCV